jgi:uncharacterized membrane protein
MILMALDHVRDLMHITSVTQQPTDLATASPALFLTRWVTHLCAPTFVFLSGVSACLSIKREGGAAAGANFLLSRGIWLIVLDFTLVNFGVWFDVHFDVFLLDVLSAIGFGFIVLRLLVNRSLKTIAVTGLAILLLHNLTDLIPAKAALPLYERIGLAFLRPDVFPLYAGKILIIGYPPLPWVGILLTGFAAGHLFKPGAKGRRSLFLKMGLLAIGAFIMLRFINSYGDPVPWSAQKSRLYTLLSFLNVTKYPPSLDFSLLFLGIMFLLFAVFGDVKNKYTAIVRTYGRVPLFYFLIHWYLLHPLVFVMAWLQGFKTSQFVFGTSFGRPVGSGLSLWGVYAVWLVLVAALYPLCRWYGRYKAAHREKAWLRFL